jgi:hypothetical protein
MASPFVISGVLEYRDGWLCLRVAEPMFNEPQLVTLWFPIERENPGDRAVLDLTGCHGSMHGGRVSFRMGTSSTAAWAQERPLPDGGKTVAIASMVTPIPCPKVRAGIQTRYRNGRWEKYLKSAGWVAA